MSMRTSSASTPAERLHLLLRAVAPEHAGSGEPASDMESLLISPADLRQYLENRLQGHAGQVRVTGPLDRRLVFVQQHDGDWMAADLAGQPHDNRDWPAWADDHLVLDMPDSWLSLARLDEQAVYRLSRPRTLLAALYHPEYFPLPRFSLGISDLARAARSTLLGEVTMADMQLGLSLPDLIRRIADDPPDILGISATFGQHDLMIKLLEAVYDMPSPPLIIAGGSLTARNEGLLLGSYPKLLIARGAGETTIADLHAYWHGDITREQVHGIGYNGAARGAGTLAIGQRHTAKLISRAQDDIFPELDLLPATFDHHGVAQVEASRGCTNFCSFCPRGHKGQWVGALPTSFPWVLDQMGRVFDRYPGISRTLYLVDEEFIGRGADAVTRALQMADTLHRAEFRWETSCRIDQVVRLDRDGAWHEERAIMWRALVARGLRRCLFGVESGVDSILTRFNKETTGEQNALAIRTLSALGVPTRYTYITFDQLMTLEELKATYTFQGRTDLLLKPSPQLTAQEIVEGVHDPEFVARLSTGKPFYSGISYMLVSMECLIGAAYTKQAQAAGLTGDVRPSMGRQDARFADPRIGVCSEWAQLWVDRHFALDYTFKSLEKILDGQPRQTVRAARVVLKDAAYTVFGHMIDAIDDTSATPIGAQELGRRLRQALDAQASRLITRMTPVVVQATNTLPKEQALLLEREHARWAGTDGWWLINAADPCGT